MNKSTLQKKRAMNYAILRTIVQDDHLLKNTLTRNNFNELIDVRAFYQRYFQKDRFIQDNPIIFNLLSREAEIAFSKLRVKVRIIDRFSESYPVSLLQDLREQAPTFLYAYGNLNNLDRKLTRLALVSTLETDETYVQSSLTVLKHLSESTHVLMVQNRSPLDQRMIEQLDSIQYPYVLLSNTPIQKCESIEDGLMYPNKTLLSFIGPMDGVMVDFQRLKIMNSLGKLTILLSPHPNDIHHFSVQNNLAWHKPSILPLVKPDETIKIAHIHTLSDVKHLNPLLMNILG